MYCSRRFIIILASIFLISVVNVQHIARALAPSTVSLPINKPSLVPLTNPKTPTAQTLPTQSQKNLAKDNRSVHLDKRLPTARFSQSHCSISEIEQIIKSAVQRYMQNNDIPGIAIALYYEGKPYLFSFGYADPMRQQKVTPDTFFEIGSVTKSFTSTLLALEVLKGTVTLQDHLGALLPLTRRNRPLARITLEQLATHTASLPRDPYMRYKVANKGKLLRSLWRWRPDHQPGTHMLYSNLGYNLLGYALENATRMPYAQLIKRNITIPLGMHDTRLDVSPQLRFRYAQGFNKRGVPVHSLRAKTLGAAGALRSTARDMVKFLMANIGVYGPPQLQEAMKFAQKGIFKAPRMVQALSWQNVTRKGITFVDKNGGVGGFSTWMGMIPDKRFGLVLLSNKRCPKFTPLGRRILLRIARCYQSENS